MRQRHSMFANSQKLDQLFPYSFFALPSEFREDLNCLSHVSGYCPDYFAHIRALNLRLTCQQICSQLASCLYASARLRFQLGKRNLSPCSQCRFALLGLHLGLKALLLCYRRRLGYSCLQRSCFLHHHLDYRQQLLPQFKAILLFVPQGQAYWLLENDLSAAEVQ